MALPGKPNDASSGEKLRGIDALPVRSSGIIRSSTDGPPSDAPGQAGTRDKINRLIQQLAWYYRVNDCAEREQDDAIEVPIIDLRLADEIAHDLGLPDGPSPLTNGSD